MIQQSTEAASMGTLWPLLFMVAGVLICFMADWISRMLMKPTGNSVVDTETRIKYEDYVIRTGILVCCIAPIMLFYS